MNQPSNTNDTDMPAPAPAEAPAETPLTLAAAGRDRLLNALRQPTSLARLAAAFRRQEQATEDDFAEGGAAALEAISAAGLHAETALAAKGGGVFAFGFVLALHDDILPLPDDDAGDELGHTRTMRARRLLHAFDAMDLDGAGRLAWEQLTDFLVDAAGAAGDQTVKGPGGGDGGAANTVRCQYSQRLDFVDRQTRTLAVIGMDFVEELGALFVVETNHDALKIYLRQRSAGGRGVPQLAHELLPAAEVSRAMRAEAHLGLGAGTGAAGGGEDGSARGGGGGGGAGQTTQRHVLDSEWVPAPHALLAVSCLDGYISFWDVHADELAWRKPSLVAHVHARSFTPQTGLRYVPLCDCLFSWSSGGPESFEILVWELKFGLTGPPSIKCELHHHLAPVKAALFVPAPHCVLATASMDRTVALWDCSLTAGVQEEPEICGNLEGHKCGGAPSRARQSVS